MFVKNTSAPLWKNHRIINKETNLIVPENRERLFENAECVALLENILSIYQQKGELPAHYLHYNMTSNGQNETITYKAYVDYRCTNRDRKDGKNRVVGDFYILYRIVRLNKESTNCQYPFLILFDAKAGEVACSQCENKHVHRITESSFYVTRTQFAYEMMSKLKFMEKYAKYEFTPQNFISTKVVGDTPYQHVRDHNYEPSFYFERCEKVLVDSIKLQLLKRGLDCESMRLEEFEDEKEIPYHTHCALFKLKYMCRKCQGKEIWTTRDKVTIRFTVLPLEGNFQQMIERQNQVQAINKKEMYCFYGQTIYCQELTTKRTNIYEECEELKDKYKTKMTYNPQKNPQSQEEGEDKLDIQTLFKTERRRLDRSIKRELDQHEQFQKDIQSVNRWHRSIQSYKYPYLILFNIKVPKMPCIRCKKEKDGLIYISNLVDQAHSILNRKVINTMLNLNKKKAKVDCELNS